MTLVLKSNYSYVKYWLQCQVFIDTILNLGFPIFVELRQFQMTKSDKLRFISKCVICIWMWKTSILEIELCVVPHFGADNMKSWLSLFWATTIMWGHNKTIWYPPWFNLAQKFEAFSELLLAFTLILELIELVDFFALMPVLMDTSQILRVDV